MWTSVRQYLLSVGGTEHCYIHPWQPNAGTELIPEHLHKDQYCGWKWTRVPLLQSQYLQRYMDGGVRWCVHTSLLLESPSWALPAPWDFSPAPLWSYCRLLSFSWVQLRHCYSLAQFLCCFTSELISALQPAGVECKGNGEWVADSPRQRHRTDRRMLFHTQRRMDRKFPELWGEWETEGDSLGSFSGL